MQTSPAPHPLLLELWNGGLNRGAHDEAHVMEFHLATIDAATKYDQKELGDLRRAHAGKLLMTTTHQQRRRSLLRWW